MAVIFKEPILHGATRFAPTIATAFDDAGAEAYFIAAGFAEATTEPFVMLYGAGAVEIDPATVFGDGPNKGNLVMEG